MVAYGSTVGLVFWGWVGGGVPFFFCYSICSKFGELRYKASEKQEVKFQCIKIFPLELKITKTINFWAELILSLFSSINQYLNLINFEFYCSNMVILEEKMDWRIFQIIYADSKSMYL